MCFFFQAEDGIRDLTVTGVQTCALPILIVAGTVTKKMAPQVVRLYNQMPEPKYVIAMGACAISGGPFKQGYNVLKGIDRYIPVDVHIPGCPPRPEALIHAFMTLQQTIQKQNLTGN